MGNAVALIRDEETATELRREASRCGDADAARRMLALAMIKRVACTVASGPVSSRMGRRWWRRLIFSTRRRREDLSFSCNWTINERENGGWAGTGQVRWLTTGTARKALRTVGSRREVLDYHDETEDVITHPGTSDAPTVTTVATVKTPPPPAP
jgi:hypothetical protein